MEKVCSSKRDAVFTSSPPTELVMYDRSETPCYFPQTFETREPVASEEGLLLQRFMPPRLHGGAAMANASDVTGLGSLLE